MAYLGDGLNDVLVLSRACPGISLSRSSPAALGVVLDDLQQLPEAISLARWSARQAGRVLRGALIYNALLVPLAAMGWLDPAWTAACMGLSSLAVTWTAYRPISSVAPPARRNPSTEPDWRQAACS